MKIIDASTLLAVLHKEPGADDARSHIRGSLLSAVNLTEVYQGAIEANVLYLAKALISAAQIKVIAFDEVQAEIAAEIKQRTKGMKLSLADRACLALGVHKKGVVVTADQIWDSLGLDLEIVLFRGRLN